MKKILSVALSTAMAFSMFASVAFGADAKLTPEQQFNALKEAGIVSGFPDGLSHLEKTLTRAELAKIIVNSLSLEPVDATSYNDKNYANHWGRTYIEAATQAGILNGKDAAKKLFDPNGAVTVQELAKVLVTALKLEVPADANNTASAWAKGYVAAAVNAGYLADGINYQAQATRSQAVVAAYAIYEAAQVPTVKSYKVVDSKNVEFTLSTDEVVKVTLETALEANKETEVTFKTAAGEEIKTKVTWVVTEATKIDSVSASNLKEVVVTFDGTVDEESAETVGNYNLGKTIKSATMSEDGKSVTLLLDGDAYGANSLQNQKEAKLTVDGVKSSLKTKTFKQEIKFTPVDVTTPEVKELVGLGTSAFQVTFSEPVDKASALSTVNYKIDGKAISGIVEYQTPNVVIVSTTMTTGTHKLTISNVRDFSDLKVLPVEREFTVAEDTAAPEVVSAKTNDFKVVEIEFNEPIKSVSKAYNGISSKTASKVERSGKKVTLTFADPLTYSENNIVLEGVTDYSGNNANREVKVTPTPDSERPTVTSVTSDVVGGNHELTVTYSEDVINGNDKANYTLRNKDGKVVVGKGTDANGHPIQAITTVSAKKYVIKLAGLLDAGDYTLEVTGVKDTAYVANTILPYSASLKIADAKAPELKKVWVEKDPAYNGKEDVYIYATYTKDFAVEGNGSALERAKYQVAVGGLLGTFEALPTNSYVDAVSPNTVRITIPQATAGKYVDSLALKVSLVADAEGNFGYESAGYVGSLAATPAISNVITAYAAEVKAVSDEELTVKFDGRLNSINASDFAVVTTGGTQKVATSVKSYSYSGGDTIVTFTFADGAIPVNPELAGNATKFQFATGVTKLTTTTQDGFGVKVDVTTPIQVLDKVAPESVDFATGKSIDLSYDAAASKYVAKVKFNEPVTALDGTGAVTVNVAGATAITVSGVAISDNAGVLEVRFATDRTLVATDVVTVSLAGNASAHAVVDAKGNAAVDFSRGASFGEAAAVAGTLTVTPAAGTATGTTALTLAPTLTAGNSYVVVISASAVTAPVAGTVAPAGAAYTAGADLAVTPGQYVQVYEVDGSNGIVNFGQVSVAAGNIAP